MAKRRVGRYPKAFKQMTVERLTRCENIVALSREPGVSRRLLYTWRDQLDPVERSEGPPANARESTLRKEVSQWKRLLAEKMLEVDFFIYAHIRDVMSRQGRLSIERMCDLAQVSRAGFYRSLRAYQPVDEEMDVRSAIRGSPSHTGVGMATGASRRNCVGAACW